MRKDSIYWIYRLRLLTERFEHLSEAQRKLAYHNAALVTANEMAHSGSNKNEIHSFLTDNYQPMYNKAVMRHWYTSGGDVPVVNYVRHHVAKLFGTTGIKSPHFEGRQIHDTMTNDELLKFIIDSHNNSKEIHSKILPPTITLYRGIGNLTNSDTYIPHVAESWTTHLDTARKFANIGMGAGSTIPHVFKSEVNRDDILWSHLTRSKNLFIPPDSELEGKEEFVPIGHKLKNIERIE